MYYSWSKSVVGEALLLKGPSETRVLSNDERLARNMSVDDYPYKFHFIWFWF